MIPRKLLFGNPERASVKLSHDGARISYLAPLNRVMNVWVAPVDAIDEGARDSSENNPWPTSRRGDSRIALLPFSWLVVSAAADMNDSSENNPVRQPVVWADLKPAHTQSLPRYP